MDIASVLGANIRKYRKKKGMTQAELAERVFITAQNVSKWEKGLSLPGVQTLVLLCDVLCVSSEQLLNRRIDPDSGKVMIGIDGGGTKTAFCLFTEDGSVLAQKELGGTNPNVIKMAEALDILSEGIDLMLSYCPEVSAVFAGIAGCGLSKNAEAVKSFLMARYPDIEIEVKGDALNSIYSTPYYKSCFLAIAGTGSVIYANDGVNLKKVGGWGYLLDRGYNGFYLGTEVFRAVLADEDGVSERTLLTKMLRERMGDDSDLLVKFYTLDKAEIASYSRLLFLAYDSGDGVACKILESNISLLSEMLTDVIKRNPECEKKVVITGGLTARKDILERFLKLGEDAELIFPELPPIYGACHYCARHFGQVQDGFSEKFKQTCVMEDKQ